MFSFISTLIVFILVIGVLVFVHEFGHYIAAKLVGIKVEEFAIGMGPKIFGFRSNETDYSIRIFPIGGYVKMLGEGDYDLLSADSYGGKPPLQRLFVLVAGVFMNIVLAIFLLYIQGWHQGFKYRNIEGHFSEQYRPWFGEKTDDMLIVRDIQVDSILFSKVNKFDILTEVNGERYTTVNLPQKLIEHANKEIRLTFVRYDSSESKEIVVKLPEINSNLVGKNNSPLATIALLNEDSPLKDKVSVTDIILAINGESYELSEFRNIIEANKGKKVKLLVADLRGENKRDIEIQLENKERPLGIIFVANNSPDILLGINTGLISFIEFNGNSVWFSGVGQTLNTIQNFVFSISQLFKKSLEIGSAIPVVDNVGGAIGIFEILSSIILLFGFWGVLELTALFSVNLAILNILPIPALDGGHVVFTLLEMITRKKLNTQLYNYLTLGGFIFLMTLMLFITVMDLVKYTPIRGLFCNSSRDTPFICDLTDYTK